MLGLAQGLTEFIPVSSSAHLNFLHAYFGQSRELGYDVVLSIGTTVALAWYFRHDWKALLTDPAQRKLRDLIFISCIPAVLLGFVLKKTGMEDRPPVSEVWFNAVLLSVAGVVLWVSDRTGRQTRELKSVNLADALIVGCSQALALFPGVSRSGSTLTAGLFRGMTREAAARFSFLMSLPISTGAILFSCYSDIKKGVPFGASPISLLVGVLVSGISGFWAIGFLLNFLKRRSVTPFLMWRLAVTALVFTMMATHQLPAPPWFLKLISKG